MTKHHLRKNLTSSEAARILGASEASIKRWADRGLLPSQRTAGGHRRFRPEDVASFRHENIRESAHEATANCLALPLPEHVRTAATPSLQIDESDEVTTDALFDALTGEQPAEVSALLFKSYLHGATLTFIFDELLAPAMRKIGDLWRQGTLTVAEEHLATRAAISAVQTLSRVMERREAGHSLAVCCSVEDDFHELPIHCAELLLKTEGWEVVNLGASTPFYALSETVSRLNPRLLCVAATMLNHLDRAVREYRELRAATERAGTSIVLGGAGFAHNDLRHRFPAELHAGSFRQLLDFAASLNAKRTDS